MLREAISAVGTSLARHPSCTADDLHRRHAVEQRESVDDADSGRELFRSPANILPGGD